MINDKLEDIINMHKNRWEMLKKEDKQKINWMSLYTPEEIIYAANMIPYRITGETRPNYPMASAYMYQSLCPYVLSCFQEVLEDKHNFAAGTIIVNACDARRRLYDVWKFYKNPKFMHLLDFPKVINPDTRQYFRNQLKYLIKAIEMEFSCNITDDSLKEAISLCNETRTLLNELYELRRQDIAHISSSQVINIIKASMTGFKKEFNQKLSLLIEDIKRAEDNNTKNNYKLLLCGSYFDHTEITDIFESYGAEIACEDISVGLKYFEGQVDLEEDPLDALACYYLEKASCARMVDTGKRFERLWNLVESYNIQSVIYFTLKFCDNNLLDFPFFKRKLNDRGIPVLLIEAERSVDNIEQIKNRIHAFLESQIGIGEYG